MVINQGDIFWTDLGEPYGSGPGYRHPYVVIQNNVYNQSRIKTTIGCALTSNLKRANAPAMCCFRMEKVICRSKAWLLSRKFSR